MITNTSPINSAPKIDRHPHFSMLNSIQTKVLNSNLSSMAVTQPNRVTLQIVLLPLLRALKVSKGFCGLSQRTASS